ncbi:MAG: tetratricopeptide repeat protein [Pirellulaceae bacterium]|nr:tetratricopeptide repeat protein [Pirellulaceae bacterium]
MIRAIRDRLCVLTACLLIPCAAVAAEDLTTARARLLVGRYDEAAEQYALFAKKEPVAAIGLARCQVAVGRRDEAMSALTKAAERFPQSAKIPAELAALALARGDLEAAEKHAAAALALDKDSVGAHLARAELLAQQGKLDEAQREYGWFAGYFARAPRIDDPFDLVLLGRGIAEHARWTRNSNTFRRLVSDVFPAAVRQDKDFWPARLEMALLFLEKFNEADALSEITAALAINSQAAELHAARAALALGSFDLAAAQGSLDRALEINPELLWAHQLRADWLLADIRPAEAIDVLTAAKKLNPRDEGTLGRLAAAYEALDGRPGGMPSPRVAMLIDEVAARNPHGGRFYLAAGEACDRMRRFPRAAEYYRLAAEKMPQLISARGQLGLVLMRLGEEAEAAQLLAESFAIDPFNVRVKNQLEVLDLLQGYAVIETEHFVIKFDRGHDELLARYAARRLEEEIYPLVTERLAYEPAGKTLIEIFSRRGTTSGHSWFSARMVGLPFIGTVGACAGKMLALASPTELKTKYNWSQVLRHELVHVVNLQQTDFNVPHWFTEGLAVHLEDQPRPRDWNELLARRARAGQLYSLDNITLGFVRPKSGEDWTLAYCQAELYIEYLREKYGAEAPGKMLAAYGEHRSTGQALGELFGVLPADFEAGYRQFIERQIAQAGPAAEAKPALAELQKRAAENPADAAAAARLALAWLDRDDKPQARRWALAAQKLAANEPLAAYVLARLQLSIGDADGALELLEKGLDKSAPQEDLLALLAALKLRGGNSAAALALYELGDAKFPHSDRWVKALAKLHLQAGDDAKLPAVLKRLAVLEPENGAIRKKLAQLAISAQDFAAAEKLAKIAIDLDVHDEQAHALLAAALAGLDKHSAAVEEYTLAIQLDGLQADWRAGLAQSLVKLGKTDAARQALDKLRDLDANHPAIPALEKVLLP